MANPTTQHFLGWLAARLVGVYGENENTDFVLRLNEEAAKAQTLRTNIANNMNTYQLVQSGATPPDADGRILCFLSRRGKGGRLGAQLWLLPQEAADLSDQLDAPIDYFND
jgi:hypothetical protein